tara:strand:+ start:383 stop:490 length:108 start_codon:yes stop_codon:yes gene_type:complete
MSHRMTINESELEITELAMIQVEALDTIKIATHMH